MTKPTTQQAQKERQENIEKFMHEMIDKNVPLNTLDKICKKLKESGIDVKRATLNRDLNELGFIKIDGSYVYKPPENAEEQKRKYLMEKFLRDNITINNCSECGIFPITTIPGTGKGVASRLVSLFPELILGTVADDNMVLVITKKVAYVSEIYNEMRNIEKSKNIQPAVIANILFAHEEEAESED